MSTCDEIVMTFIWFVIVPSIQTFYSNFSSSRTMSRVNRPYHHLHTRPPPTFSDIINAKLFSLCDVQLPGSPLTRCPLTPTSSSPTTTWQCHAAAMMTGWWWETPPFPVASITGRWQWIATTITLTRPLASLVSTSWRMWCWGRTTRPGPCTWTTTAPGSCTTTHTPTGRRANLVTVGGVCSLFLVINNGKTSV